MADITDEPARRNSQNHIEELKEEVEQLERRIRRRDAIDNERKLASSRRRAKDIAILTIYAVLAVAIGIAAIKGVSWHYEIERIKVETEQARIRQEVDVQNKRLEMELEQAESERKFRALRLLAAILGGPGSPAEKKNSIQLLVDLHIDLGALTKVPSKLADLIGLGAKVIGPLVGVLNELGGPAGRATPTTGCCGTPQGLIVYCPAPSACCKAPPAPRPPNNPQGKKNNCRPNVGGVESGPGVSGSKF